MSNYFNSEDFARLYKNASERNQQNQRTASNRGAYCIENPSVSFIPDDEDIVLADVKFEELEIK